MWYLSAVVRIGYASLNNHSGFSEIIVIKPRFKIGFAVLGLTALVAGIAVGASGRATRLSLSADWIAATAAVSGAVGAYAALKVIQEMREDRKSRYEPFVLFDIEATNNGIYWMVIENMGSGIAYNVELNFEPVPIDYDEVPVNERPLLQFPIPMIGPGKRIPMFFHTNPLLYQRDVPREFQVSVKYTGEGGFRDERTYKFDFNKHKGQVFPPKTAGEELHELNKHIKELTRAISRHSPLGGGFLVENWDSYQKRLEKQAMERRQAREDDNDGTES